MDSKIQPSIPSMTGSQLRGADDPMNAYPAKRKPRLLDHVREAIRTRHYSVRTEEASVAWIKRFILFHGRRHPAEMGEAEINMFLSHLAVDDLYSRSEPGIQGSTEPCGQIVGGRRLSLRFDIPSRGTD